MALELLSQLRTFEYSTEHSKIPFDSDSLQNGSKVYFTVSCRHSNVMDAVKDEKVAYCLDFVTAHHCIKLRPLNYNSDDCLKGAYWNCNWSEKSCIITGFKDYYTNVVLSSGLNLKS